MFRLTGIRLAVAAMLFLALGALAACSAYSGDTPLPSRTVLPYATPPEQSTNSLMTPEIFATPSRLDRSPTPPVTRTSVAPIVSATPTVLVQAATAVPSPSAPTVAPVATLPREQRLALQQQLLDSNGDCRLPCWWGITPGRTAWSTTTTFFTRLGVQPYPVSTPGSDHVTYYKLASFDGDPNYVLRPRIAVQDDTIRSLAIRGFAESTGAQIITDPEFARAWHTYVLSSVLTTYGQPASVAVYADLTAGCNSRPCSQYVLVLSYQQLGFLVSYYWIDDTWAGGATVALCPSVHLVHGIDLYLQSPDATDPVENLLALPDTILPRYFPELADLRPLESVTGWTNSTFYQTYSQPGTQGCMETPTSLWPHR